MCVRVLPIEPIPTNQTHPTFLHILKKFFCSKAFVLPRVVSSQQLESYCGSIICISGNLPLFTLMPFVWSCTSTSLDWWKFRPTTPLSSVTYTGSSFLPQFNVACENVFEKFIYICHIEGTVTLTSDMLFDMFTGVSCACPSVPCFRLNFKNTSSNDWQWYMDNSTRGDSSANNLPLLIKPIWKKTLHRSSLTM